MTNLIGAFVIGACIVAPALFILWDVRPGRRRYAVTRHGQVLSRHFTLRAACTAYARRAATVRGAHHFDLVKEG